MHTNGKQQYKHAENMEKKHNKQNNTTNTCKCHVIMAMTEWQTVLLHLLNSFSTNCFEHNAINIKYQLKIQKCLNNIV